MMPIAVAAAAATQNQPGWGGPIALLVASLVFWAGVTLYRRWEHTKAGSFSSAEAPLALDTGKPQVRAESDSTDSGSAKVVPLRSKRVEQALRKHADKGSTAAVKQAAKETGVSEATAWRKWRQLRKDGDTA